MGHKVYLVIEKMSEIAIVLEEAERLNVVPRLGVRARLASQGSGKWQSSGGEKSKFGLAANQVLQLVEIMREHGRLDSIQLLHFHLGSQMANIRDIATGVRESARFYVELHKLGVNIQCFDVGGGLGVDYEGTRSQSDCSVNYGLGVNQLPGSERDSITHLRLPEQAVWSQAVLLNLHCDVHHLLVSVRHCHRAVANHSVPRNAGLLWRRVTTHPAIGVAGLF
jgi:hypothetical protein